MLILWVMDGAGLWWLWAWAILMGFSLVMAWAYPTFIAPLFNRFTPLADDALRSRVEACWNAAASTARAYSSWTARAAPATATLISPE